MKSFLLAGLGMIFAGTAYGQAAPVPFKWLEGKWVRTNVKPGNSGFEQWAGTKGMGGRLQGKDTVFLEHLEFVTKENNLYLVVTGVEENDGPVSFKVTATAPNGFTCENPQHDFPKKIVYTRTGKKLKATISGDGKAVDFLFDKEG